MTCPGCTRADQNGVSKTVDGGDTVTRIRYCACGERWTTTERINPGSRRRVPQQRSLPVATNGPPVASGGHPQTTNGLGVGGDLSLVLIPESSSDPISSGLISKSSEVVRKRNGSQLGTYSSAFLTFWEAYPKRVGKGAAWISWKRQQPLLAKVMWALQWQVSTPEWTKDGGAYIPNPATYLNQRRWEDEPRAAPAAKPRRPYA